MVQFGDFLNAVVSSIKQKNGQLSLQLLRDFNLAPVLTSLLPHYVVSLFTVSILLR